MFGVVRPKGSHMRVVEWMGNNGCDFLRDAALTH